jgi:hypothetical protein
MHPVDQAERIIAGTWPWEPKWILESPDGGETVYRRLLGKGFNNKLNPKQLYRVGTELVADIDKLDEEYHQLLNRTPQW